MDFQNIFNRDFFPTPCAVIKMMMQGEPHKGWSIGSVSQCKARKVWRDIK